MKNRKVKIFVKSPSKFTKGLFSKKESKLEKSILKSTKTVSAKKIGLFTKISKFGSFISAKISAFSLFLLKTTSSIFLLFIAAVINPTLKYSWHYYQILKATGLFKGVKWVLSKLKGALKWLGSKIWKGLKWLGGKLKNFAKKLLKYAGKKLKIVGKWAKKWFYKPLRNAFKKFIWAPIKRLWTKKIWVMGKPSTLLSAGKKGSFLWRVVNSIKIKSHALWKGLKGISNVISITVKKFISKISMKGILASMKASAMLNLKTLAFLSKTLKANILTKMSGTITGKIIMGVFKAASGLVKVLSNVILSIIKAFVGDHAVTAIGMFIKNLGSIIAKGNLWKITSAILKQTGAKFAAKVSSSMAGAKKVMSKVLAIASKVINVGLWAWLAWDLSKSVDKRINEGINRDIAGSEITVGFFTGLIAFAAGSVAWLIAPFGLKKAAFVATNATIWGYLSEKLEEYRIIEHVSKYVIKPIRHTFVGIDLQDVIENSKKYYAHLHNLWDSKSYYPEEFSYGPIEDIEYGIGRMLTISSGTRILGAYPMDMRTEASLKYNDDVILSEKSEPMKYEKQQLSIAAGYSGRTLLWGFYNSVKKSHDATHISYISQVLIPYYKSMLEGLIILVNMIRIKRSWLSARANKSQVMQEVLRSFLDRWLGAALSTVVSYGITFVFKPVATLSNSIINTYYGHKLRRYASSLNYERSGSEALNDTLVFLGGILSRGIQSISSKLYSNKSWDFLHDDLDQSLSDVGW
jgi:hypothetical protein